MTNWFYFNASGEKVGPITSGQLYGLVQQGTVTPEMWVENSEGHTVAARNVKGLKFPEIVRSKSTPPAPSPFIASSSHAPPHFDNQQPSYPGDQSPASEQWPGFFDIGFTRFISNTWISIIWFIVIGVHFLAAIGAMICSAAVESPVPFLIALFAVPISLLFSRMALELEVIFFRIETNTRESKEHLREIKELLARK